MGDDVVGSSKVRVMQVASDPASLELAPAATPPALAPPAGTPPVTSSLKHGNGNGVLGSSPGSTVGRRPARAAATNARDLINGKRERPGFFNAEEEARKEAAAKRAAAKAEKARLEEEMIARWVEADRVKMEEEAEKKRLAKIEKERAAAVERGEEYVPNEEEAGKAGGGGEGAVEDEVTVRGEHDESIVGTTGRSKKNPKPVASAPTTPPLPPPPPEPTEAFEAPLEDDRGVPIFGCHKCNYNRHGCFSCLKGPPVQSSYKPSAALHYDVPPVPVYYPTEEQWANNPLDYINSIRPEAEKYGVCNIVAPASWQPEFRMPNKADLRFRTRVQAVDELQNRPAGPSKRARVNAAKAAEAMEAAGISVSPGTLLGSSGVGMGGGGGRMGGGGGRMGGGVNRMGGGGGASGSQQESGDDDDRERTEGGVDDKSEQASKEGGDAADGGPSDAAALGDGQGADGPQGQVGKSNKSGKRSHKKKLPTEGELDQAKEILAQYGFAAGERHTVSTLEHYSRYFKRKYFSKGGQPVDVSVRDLEGEFWRLVEAPEGRSVEVIYGADIATIEVGSGFTAKDDECEDAPDQKVYATSPWNVCNMPYNPKSCLKHVGKTTGITVPWLYFGMTLSTFCWHVEDHYFYSVNYHHFGEPKVWYSIPATYSAKFEEVMRRRLPHLFKAQPDLLHSLVTILSPAALREEGIPVYRAEQHPRSYIITFPNAYHAGFNTGFNCAEAVNFAPIDWLPYGAMATERYARDARYQSVAHDQLLSTLCEAEDEAPSEGPFRAVLASVMRERVGKERERLYTAVPSLVAKQERMAGTDEAPDLFERDCCVCQADLNWAGVRCECKAKKLYCLRCVKRCKCVPERSTLFYRHTLEELEEKCRRLEGDPPAGKEGEKGEYNAMDDASD